MEPNQQTLPPQSPPELPPVEVEEVQEDRRWPTLLAYGFLALVIAAALVFLGRWAYDSFTEDDNQAPVATNTENAPSEEKSANKTSESENSTNENANSGSSSENEANSGSNGSASSTSNLPNNGPGHVVAIFVVTAVGAGLLHYKFQQKRSQSA